MTISEESTKLAVEFCFTEEQAQQVLDLLAINEDVYDIEVTREILIYASDHGIDPCGLASFIHQLIKRRTPIRVALPLLPRLRLHPKTIKVIQRFLDLPDSWTNFIIHDD